MATRATYQIGDTTFYCHWDGYPRGAALRFINMVKAKVSFDKKEIDGMVQAKGGYPFAFIRGNLDAEPTESHDAHGDTEYRYTLKIEDRGAVLVSVDKYDNKSDDWEVYCTNVDLAEFIRRERDDLARFYLNNQNNPKFRDLPKGFKAIEESVDAELPMITRVVANGFVFYSTFDTTNEIALVHANLAKNQVGTNKTHYLAIAKAWADGMAIGFELDHEDALVRMNEFKDVA